MGTENVIQVGGFYQVDQSKLLPSITPTQLEGARVVMVSEIDQHTVCVACPSIHSLHAHITEQGYQFGNLIPALDARYMMTPQVAAEVFFRRIPTKEIADRSNIWSFWAFTPAETATNYQTSVVPSRDIWTASKEGPCCSEPKFTRMVQWGSSTDKEEVKAKAGEKGIEVIVLDDDDDDIEQENEEDLNLMRSRKKRKLEDPVARARWLAERYKLQNEKVEKLSIEVTKLKRDAAAAVTTILKNKDRNEAGVEDPCRTPPPPGDNPTHQDPACARELKEVREELDKLRAGIGRLLERPSSESSS
ncbi:PREDICTED: protein DYAD-like [Prunus mume]|uniref:Protein DYAD-like n=1 Tax=Prunus mume TaxID=102107 RepID=A0ABM0NI69_PRUMU|nr:PREDICTED: protein DYAD-like [Prunus mume]